MSEQWCAECCKNVEFIHLPFKPGMDFLKCPYCGMEYRILPFFGENYIDQWDKVNMKNKRVLDIGADMGSTADFFLLRGAKEVIAVEGESGYYSELVRNSEILKGITPFFAYINNPNQLRELISHFKPDIVKCDCEGCESHFIGVPNDIFRIPTDYMIEIHGDINYSLLTAKFIECEYEILDVNVWIPEAIRDRHEFTPIIWAKRK